MAFRQLSGSVRSALINQFLTATVVAQALLGGGVLLRLLRTAGGERIRPAERASASACVSVIVPVLNERRRLGPCLEGLIAQGAEVGEILVVDGGSTDGTPALVESYAARDRRVRLVDAGPAPADWNGKVWGLQRGWERISGSAGWVLTIDADVRPAPALTCSLLAHAHQTGLPALSVATRQEIDGPGEGLVHPALLATLVYRFGIPGQVAERVGEVQANGQCFLYRRDLLVQQDGFAGVRESICEDMTLARAIVARGQPVGFYEAGELARVRMYAGWRATWRGWSRSLPLRDRYAGLTGWRGLLEVTLVQALPLPLLLVLRLTGGSRWMTLVLGILTATRLGVLLGMARAYRRRPWSYWLSPLCDGPVAVQLWRNALRRRHEWRGRVIVRGET